MSKTFLSEEQINNSTPSSADRPNLARTLTAPMPQVLLVTRDPDLGEAGIGVRTAVLAPLSWGPYTKSIAIPRGDEKVARCLRANAPCVLGLPSRQLLRQLAICRLWLPRGISEAAIARLQLFKSPHVEVPFVHDCPVNLECVIDQVEPYHTHLVAFARVVGANIDPAYIFWDRARIIQLYPTNFADEIVDPEHGVRMRVSLLRDIQPCPTFPLGPKSGWPYGGVNAFDSWVKDLADENHISRVEQKQIDGWHARWNEIFAQTALPERVALKGKLERVCDLLIGQNWKDLHAYLAANRTTENI